ncbi:MAG TPA: hypothetical protein VET87_20905 [Rubrivivax sp.]|jgi:hypothetical protein|nr:hypothetical protein [Rubrivivax sp.]
MKRRGFVIATAVHGPGADQAPVPVPAPINMAYALAGVKPQSA